MGKELRLGLGGEVRVRVTFQEPRRARPPLPAAAAVEATAAAAAATACVACS